MEKCLIIINKNAGKCRKCSTEKVSAALCGKFEFDTVYLPSENEIDFSGYRNIAVCGGDGTLSTVLQQLYNTNRTIYYFPCGTLNDKAKSKRITDRQRQPEQAVIGKTNNGIFTYVFATGAFTPIGYAAGVYAKQRLGILAYAFKIMECYRVNRIRAEISISNYHASKTEDGIDNVKTNAENRKNITESNNVNARNAKENVALTFADYGQSTNARNSSKANENAYSGEFNLIMFIKSPRCFGFRFNRAYKEEEVGGQLLLIRSPKHDGLLGKIEMFFPFFRVFFLGMKNECDDTVIFKNVQSAEICLPSKTSFCVDGEQGFYDGKITVDFQKTKCRLLIVRGIK